MLSAMSSSFSTYQYQHTGAASRSSRRWWAIGGLLLVGLGVLVLAPPVFPLGIIVWVVAWVVYGTAPKHLKIGSRYLICGEHIVYYGNVKRVTWAKTKDRLTLRLMNGTDFVLERDKFPTGARREPKITHNKTVKFENVSRKLMTHIQMARPDVEVLSP